MKKSFLFTFVFLSVTTMLLAFGDTETRSLKSFEQLSVATGIEAIIEKGTTNSIKIDADGVDLDKVKTEVSGDRLTVKIENKWKIGWTSKRKVIVHITYTETLDDIEASSGASIYSEDILTGGELDLDASSGSRIDVEVDVQKLGGEVSSGATIKLSGRADRFTGEASSGSSLGSYDLAVDNADLDASSGSSVKVTVNDKIVANASSGASVKYKGNPSNTNIDKSSGGSVKRQ